MVDLHDKDSMLEFLKSLKVVQPNGQVGKMTFFQLASGTEIQIEEASVEQLRTFVRKMLLPNGNQPNKNRLPEPQPN